MARLDRKNVLIIGAASGIGASVMERFVREGAKVWGTGRRGQDIKIAAAGAGAVTGMAAFEAATYSATKRFNAAVLEFVSA